MSNPFSPLAKNALLQGRYRIVELIGKGGMGAVYQARDERLGNVVALKQNFYGDDEQLKRAFGREAKLLAHLKHAALPRVTDYFTEGFGQYLVMEFIAGDDLMTLLKQRGGPFPVNQVLAWADQLLDALQYLHTQNPPVIHRDIKPQNLKLSADERIILLDFGLAKGTTTGLTSMMAGSSLMGFTPGYAPLEQMTGKGTDARSDLYSLAATLYHLLTNQSPPDAIMRSGEISIGDPDPLAPARKFNDLIPHGLSAALQSAMAQKRDDRPGNAGEMRRILKQFKANEKASGLHTAGTIVEGSAQIASTADEAAGPAARYGYETVRTEGDPPTDGESTRERQPKPLSQLSRMGNQSAPLPVRPEVIELARMTPPRYPGEIPAGLYTAANIGRPMTTTPRTSSKTKLWILASILTVAIVVIVFLIWVYRPQSSGPVTGQGNQARVSGQTAEQKTQSPDPSANNQSGQPPTGPQSNASDVTAPVQYVSIDMGSGVKIELAPIPSGRFIMGGDLPDDGKAMHRVTISKPFYIGKYPVTQAQWQTVVHNNPSHFKDCGPDCPVEEVSWNDAQVFIRELNARRRDFTFRLPTEAEWEYAARAGTTTEYPGQLDEIAWWINNSGGKTHPVGKKKPNAWGLYDTNGNVMQWVQDRSNYDEYNYPSSPATDPQGPSTGNERRSRGGAWNAYSNQCSSAFRGAWIPDGRDSHSGFRVAADRR